METLKQATYRNLIWSATIGLASAFVAAPFSLLVAAGAALGALSSAMGIRLIHQRLEQIATIPKNQLQRAIYEWMAVRMAIYAVAFGAAYGLDRVHNRALLGAVGGFLVFRTAFITSTFLSQKRLARQK